MEVDGGVSATCGGCMALSLWSPRRWRDAMFVGPFGPSLRSQATTGPCGYPALEQKATIHFLCPFLVCAFGEQERPTALVALPLVWSSPIAGAEATIHLSQNNLAGLQEDFERDLFAMVGVNQLHIELLQRIGQS